MSAPFTTFTVFQLFFVFLDDGAKIQREQGGVVNRGRSRKDLGRSLDKMPQKGFPSGFGLIR